MGLKLNYKFWFMLCGTIALVITLLSLGAYSLASAKLKQDISYLNKRTTLQLNIEKERVVSWLSTIEHYGKDFVDAEPLRTFVVALSTSESIAKNKTFLDDEKTYIKTVLDGFVYQNSLKRASIIAGTGEVFLSSGYDGILTKSQKQIALAVIAESKLHYLPVEKEDGELILEIFKPIYGFVVDDLPVAVLHMAVKLDEDFINLITKDLPVEENENILLWQDVDDKSEHIIYNEKSKDLDLVEGSKYKKGFEEKDSFFFNTIAIDKSPLYLTLEASKSNALKMYNAYLHNLIIIVALIILVVLVFVWGLFSKLIMKKYQQELEYKEKLAQQNEKTVTALLKTIELRDPYLAGHYLNVKDLALKLAKELNMTDDDLMTISYASLLAGIGKIAIPKDILVKPGALTIEETKIMQAHVCFAEEILEDMDFSLPVKDAVSQMYERLDGSGYPRALSGTEINKIARVLAVCDVFCALCSPRAYREGKKSQDALEIMQKDIALFDADVIAVLFKIINKK